MKTYTVKKHFDRAKQALRRFQTHIVCADAEAMVANHPAKPCLHRCRELGDFLRGLMIDAQYLIQEAEIERQTMLKQNKRTAKVLTALANGKAVPPLVLSRKQLAERLKAKLTA